MDATVQPEQVRLLIWDLDDTFWDGTLTEGGIRHSARNIAIVKELSARGIVNSICSKNDAACALAELQRAGLDGYFVFPRIAWQGKGAMVKSIVEASLLRPETIMFVDDNTINLNEVRHYNPGLQLAEPEILERLLEDPRFAGKDDRGLTRLAHYKLLEAKAEERSQDCGGDGSEFLRQSEIRISFHTDVFDEFDRIHELINRTNQLNYTKHRLPEDRSAALQELKYDMRTRFAHGAYIKAADKYGSYGVVGFYLSTRTRERQRFLKHLLFSCRILNMGIELFVFRKLSPVQLDILDDVVTPLQAEPQVDWITVVDDAERQEATRTGPPIRICMRGACDFVQLTHYLKYKYEVTRETAFPYRGWSVPIQAAQFASIFDALRAPEHEALLRRLPSLHPNILKSHVLTRDADAYILSFSMEDRWSHYRYKPTGLVLPIKLRQTRTTASHLTGLTYEEMRQTTEIDLDAEDWDWFRDSFEFVSDFDPARFEGNVRDLLTRLEGKLVIIVLDNTRHRAADLDLTMNRTVGEIVERAAAPFDVRFVRFDDLILAPRDVADPHHYRRAVYPRLADAIERIITAPPAAAQ